MAPRGPYWSQISFHCRGYLYSGQLQFAQSLDMSGLHTRKIVKTNMYRVTISETFRLRRQKFRVLAKRIIERPESPYLEQGVEVPCFS